MGVKIDKRKIQEVSDKANSFLVGVHDRVTKKSLTSAIIQAGAYASILTPVDTGNLLGSQHRIPITETIDGWSTGIEYTANYAINVHNYGPKNFKKVGAMNLFLKKGFEDNIPELRQIIIDGYKVK